jgi:hypothetical protein
MCLDCNCGKPNDNHGDSAHITYQQLEAAARASGIDPEMAADRIHAEAKKLRDQGASSARR